MPALDAAGALIYAVNFGGIENLNTARLPLFARVDLRATWRPRGAQGRWEMYLEVINLLNRENAGALDPNSIRPRVGPSEDRRDTAIRASRGSRPSGCVSGSERGSPGRTTSLTSASLVVENRVAHGRRGGTVSAAAVSQHNEGVAGDDE